MTNKEKITNFVKEKGTVELKDIYFYFPEMNKGSIMGCINSEIKKGSTFERVGKGKYKLKEEKQEEE